MSESDVGTRPAAAWSPVARILHWLVAGMIVLQFVLANLAESAEDGGSKFQQLVLLANHKSVGITILALAIVRLAWRLYTPPPPPLPMPAWQHKASLISHWSFYVLLIVLPLTGWLMSSASAISVSWFNLFQLPDFVAPSEDLEEVFEEIHETGAKLLFILALVHVAAAFKHALIDRDGALRRISSRSSIGIFVLVIVLGLLALTSVGRAAEDAVAEAPRWEIDYASSSIRFTAEQAGASFDGEWTDWSADLRFDASRLDACSFDVAIVVASARTGDKERDETMMDPDWFDGAGHPVTYYRADRFAQRPDGSLEANGEMLVKGSSHPVTLSFGVVENNGRYVLDGTATLDRIALGVGTGDWENTTWIGRYVEVRVHVEATLSS